MMTRQATFEDTRAVCPHCREAIRAGEQVARAPHGAAVSVWHFECFQRTLIGSVAHQMQSCSCFVAYSTCGDIPSLAVRQAARAATGYWLRQRQGQPSRQMDLKHTPPECDRAGKTEFLNSVLHLVCKFYPNSFQAVNQLSTHEQP